MYLAEPRRVLKLTCNGQVLKGYPYGLNEIAILKRDSSSMITIRAYINGELLNVYQADGLIVATPTGSTGYSLSVGGPILVPQSGTISLTPVAPHSLNVRPIVIRDEWEVTLEVESRSHNFLIAIDGRSETFREGTRLTIRRRILHPYRQALPPLFLQYLTRENDVGSRFAQLTIHHTNTQKAGAFNLSLRLFVYVYLTVSYLESCTS